MKDGIWVKFKNMRHWNREKLRLYKVLRKAHGETVVIVFLDDSREVMTLPERYHFDRNRVDLLMGAFGCKNVSLVEDGEKVDISDITHIRGVSWEVIAFYNRYRQRIASTKDGEQRRKILADMQEDFENCVRKLPQDRDAFSDIYELLKNKCWEV